MLMRFRIIFIPLRNTQRVGKMCVLDSCICWTFPFKLGKITQMLKISFALTFYFDCLIVCKKHYLGKLLSSACFGSQSTQRKVVNSLGRVKLECPFSTQCHWNSKIHLREFKVIEINSCYMCKLQFHWCWTSLPLCSPSL